VFTNQGPKGPALQRIVEKYAPSRAVFVDDLAHHLARRAESCRRSSRCTFAASRPCSSLIPCAFAAGDAHARIDTWAEALPGCSKHCMKGRDEHHRPPR
jgi:hypothetical protein